MPNAAQRTAAIVDKGERTLRLDLLKIFAAQQQALPVTQIVEGDGVPVDTIVAWQNQFSDWFLLRRDFWKRVWNRMIRGEEIKLTSQEAFDDWINFRSLELGAELAAVSEAGVHVALRHFSVGSVQKLKRELKKSIGLQPRQVSALIKQSDAIAKAYPPERAQLLIKRLERKKLNYRAQLIARNEMSTAVNQAQKADLQSRIEEGRIEPQLEKRWSTIGDERTSDGCLENEAVGWIPFDALFPSGHSEAPRFPGCRCGMQYRVKPKE